jgi:hypothetical protein
LEDEREREVRVEANALDAVPVGAGKGARGAIFANNSAATFFVVDYASVNGSLAEEGVPPVSGPRVTYVIIVGAANDQRGVIYFLGANCSRIEHFEARTRGGATEGKALSLKWTAISPLEAT